MRLIQKLGEDGEEQPTFLGTQPVNKRTVALFLRPGKVEQYFGPAHERSHAALVFHSCLFNTD